MIQRSFALSALGIASLVLTAGCAEPGTSGSQAKEIAAVVDEFRSLVSRPDLLVERHRKYQDALVECMESEGFVPVRGPIPTVRQVAGEAALPGWRLLAMPAEDVETTGLGFVPPQPHDRIDPLVLSPDLDGDPSVLSSDEFAFEVALYGLSSEGEMTRESCQTTARERVGPLTPGEAMGAVDLESETERYSRFVVDPVVWDLGREWQECMADRGYRGIPDPYNDGGVRDYFWDHLVRDRIGVAIEDQLAIPPAILPSVAQIEADLGRNYIECIQPARDTLNGKWNEYLGYSYGSYGEETSR